MNWDGELAKPVREPVLERLKISNIPSRRLSNDPVQPKQELRHEHTNPSPPPCLSSSWDVCNSIHPYQTHTHQYCGCKNPIQTYKSCSSALKQWRKTFFSTTFLLAHLSAFFLSLFFNKETLVQLCKLEANFPVPHSLDIRIEVKTRSWIILYKTKKNVRYQKNLLFYSER